MQSLSPASPQRQSKWCRAFASTTGVRTPRTSYAAPLCSRRKVPTGSTPGTPPAAGQSLGRQSYLWCRLKRGVRGQGHSASLSAVKPSTWKTYREGPGRVQEGPTKRGLPTSCKTSCSSSFISRSTAAGDPHSSSAIPVSTLGRMLT